MARTTRASMAKANAGASTSEQSRVSSPASTPARERRTTARTKSTPKAPPKGKVRAPQDRPNTPANTGRKRKAVKQEDPDVNELPHNLGTTLFTPDPEAPKANDASPKKRVKRATKLESPDVKMETFEETEATKPKKSPKKQPKYGLTPGISPFPDYARPTEEECHEVVRLLQKIHGKVTAPKAIPVPNLEVAGCGEVPSVLDALVRTRLSANTTGNNSSTAFKGLVSRFGTLKEGSGKGSVDWDAVRQAPREEVFKAIQRGGLAQIKSRDIQDILQMAYEENIERKNAGLDASDDPAGVENQTTDERQAEISKAKHNIISLDHLHSLSTPDAINRMLEFPGIGPKTASCVAMFCLQRPSFAVDTHVFRLCQYLGWVPKSSKKGQPKVDRNTTYSHCDVRIPDSLKYPLHQLLIKHGKVCPRCRAATSQTSANWDKGCVIEHLVKRHGAKKGGFSAADRKKAQADAINGAQDGVAEGDSELSEAPEDAEDDE